MPVALVNSNLTERSALSVRTNFELPYLGIELKLPDHVPNIAIVFKEIKICNQNLINNVALTTINGKSLYDQEGWLNTDQPAASEDVADQLKASEAAPDLDNGRFNKPPFYKRLW
jgi:hypothetical protein